MPSERCCAALLLSCGFTLVSQSQRPPNRESFESSYAPREHGEIYSIELGIEAHPF